MLGRSGDVNPSILDEALQQLHTLLQHTFPSVMRRINQLHVFAGGPLLEQLGCHVFAPKQRGDRLLEGTAEQHGSAEVFLLPTIELTDSGTGPGASDTCSTLPPGLENYYLSASES